MNLDKYRNERRSLRTEDVKVPQLAPYFDEGKPAVITVRGVSAAELGWCKESAQRQRDVAALAGALIGGDGDAKAAALREIANGPAVPDDIATRQEMLASGSVKPKLTHADAVLISEDFPIEFYQITNVINRLTGAGRVLGKPKVSGKGKTSETH
jgi:hypothetical protein